MWWRPNFIQYIFLTLGVASWGVMLLVSLMLLPSLLDGPESVNFLTHDECTVTDIRYQDNLCLRDTEMDFGNLEYKPHWENCKLVEFEISNNIEINCTWIYPDFFKTERAALIAISQNWKVGDKYDCVVDTIKNICYEDKNEVVIYSLTVSGLCIIGCLSWCIFAFLRVKWKRRLRR